MKRLLFAITLLITITTFGQISHGGTPYSFNNNLNSFIPLFTVPAINIEPYKAEDAITDQYKDIPWRFGIEVPVNLNLINSGLWETLPNGDRIWRLSISSPNATSINLNYSGFYLPENATLFLYNGKTTIGAFTHENNKTNGEFATTLLKGDMVTLEYYEPVNEQGKGIIQISSVVHGYRNLFDKLKAFNSSGSCNVNAVCDTAFWGNEIRSVVMLLTSGNTRFCSGALINNTLQDGTPYILTANHCGPSTNNIFMFNYQSSNCTTNIDGPTNQTISGCTLRANDSPSDFYLVELSSTPPANYNVYYAGWSSVNIPPNKGTGIHHPSGDVKKISHDFDPLVESGYYAAGNNHWEIQDWNTGTTEGGSSGSPLFDQNHRIVGQLHGGDAACGNDAFDLYGKFSYSWETNALSSKQLKFWLDPNNSGVTVLDGYDPNSSNMLTDAVLLDISGIETFLCGDSIHPKITIRNHGSNNLISLDVFYELDGMGFTMVNWTGNLPSYAIDSINLPAMSVAGGSHIFTAYCTNPNSTTDDNLTNDSSVVNFNSNAQPVFATLYLTTDNFGAETSWLVRDLNGNIVLQGGGYQSVTGGQQIIENLCLYDTCFNFVLKDSYGDGYCCSFGNGQFQLVNATGDTLAQDYSFNGDSLTFPFCLTTGIKNIENSSSNFTIYPNPTKGIFTVSNNNKNKVNIAIYDVLGKSVFNTFYLSQKEIKIDLSHVNKGIYFIVFDSDKQRIVKRIAIQ